VIDQTDDIGVAKTLGRLNLIPKSVMSCRVEHAFQRKFTLIFALRVDYAKNFTLTAASERPGAMYNLPSSPIELLRHAA
jgi:hypothetical protein